MNSENLHVVETTRETFDRDVFERSRIVPVVVDFWAEWCGPCRMLGPILEQLAEEYDGQFVLVKANTEQIPDAAAAFGVQSIPAVFAIVDGNVANTFSGLLPEPQIREWLNQVLAQQVLADAQGLEETQPEQAELRYRSVLASQPEHAAAKIGLARCLLAQDKVDAAQLLMNELEGRGFLEPEAEKLKAALALHEKQGMDVEAIRAAAENDPDNLAKRLELAAALSGAGDFQEALDICLSLVEADRHGVGESARELMLEMFRVLPDGSELTRDYRRKLSMLLY